MSNVSNSDEPNRRLPMSTERTEAFLAELSAHGNFCEAARVASPHSRSARGAAQSFRDLMVRDADFAAAVEAAIEESSGRLLAEIHRRAIEGFTETTYDGDGNVTRRVHRFSDACLLSLAKARIAEFRQADVNVRGHVQHDHATAHDARLAAAVEQLAAQMADDRLPTTLHVIAEDLG